MTTDDYNTQNPFYILELPTSATKAEIVAKAEELYVSAATEEQRQRYRWAKEQLLTDPHVRLLHELFEMPGTQYEHVDWENFMRQQKRNPVSFNSHLQSVVQSSLKDVDISDVLQHLLKELCTHPDNEIFPSSSNAGTETNNGFTR